MTKVDLHIHSCLSPCGSLESSPREIARRAKEEGLALVGLADHNTARNCPAFAQACRRAEIEPTFGIEITSSEEVHVLAIFEDLRAALDLGELVYDRLADVPNRPKLFGDQPVVDDDENIVELIEKSLIGAVSLSLEDLYREIHGRNGLCIPAHVDRSAMSVYSQLGFLPDLPFDAVEATTSDLPLSVLGHTVICNSDAHYVEDIGRQFFTMSGADYDSLRKALDINAVELHFENR